MKFLPALAIIAAIAVSPMHAEDSGIGHAERESQANAALLYLKRIYAEALVVSEHTAISRNCGQKRRAEIEARIERIQKIDFQKNDSLNIEAQKSETRFAAVLIRAENVLTPLDTRIHTVALLRSNNQWLPAPLPGSFANTGYGYDEKSGQSVLALEAWMAKQKILRESQYRETKLTNIRNSLLQIEQEAGFDQMSAEQVVTHFLKQCKNRHVLGIVACLGPSDQKSHESLLKEIKLVTEAIQNTDAGNWTILFKPSCLALVIESDDRGNVMVGHYNPRPRSRWSSNTCTIFSFKTDMVGGRACIRLHRDPRGQQVPAQPVNKSELKNQFPTTALEKIPATKCDTTAQLLDLFLSCIVKEDFTQYIGLAPRQSPYSKSPANHGDILDHLTSSWLRLARDGSGINLTRAFTDTIVDDDIAVTTLMSSDTGSSLRDTHEQIWMIREKGSWHIVPHGMIKAILLSHAQKPDEEEENATQRINNLQINISRQHDEYIFALCAETTLPLSSGAVSADDAITCLREYRSKLRRSKMRSSLSHCIMLRDTDKTLLLQQMERLFRGAVDQEEKIEILGTSTNASWVGISVRTTSKHSGEHDYPLYLVVKSPDGPRIFANLDLRYPRNYGREILNEENWKLLQKTAPEQSISRLQSIFKEHLERCEGDMAQMQK